MSNLTCPKCGGSDYFLSKRNIVKGMGWLQRGSLKSVPVCRVCDEIMSRNYEVFEYLTPEGKPVKGKYKFKNNKMEWVLASNAIFWLIAFGLTYPPIFLFLYFSLFSLASFIFRLRYRINRHFN